VKIRLIRVISVPLFFVIFPCLLFSQIAHQTQIKLRTESKNILSVSSIMFDTAYIRVRTQVGHAVKNLTAEDFLILRDNDTANIISCEETTSAPSNDLAITFILDNSASMFHSYDSLTKYLDVFLDSLSEGFIANAMTFDNVERLRTYDGTEREKLFIASSEFTNDRTKLKDFWHSYDSIRTELTPLYETVIKGLERIIDRRKAGDTARREIVIAVTDGADNASSVNIERLSELVQVMPVTLFTINYNSDTDGRLFWLAKKTHGDHYIANNLQELQKTLEYLRKDIGSSYKLVFEFPFRGAGGSH
jgi:hypothetical protein